MEKAASHKRSVLNRFGRKNEMNCEMCGTPAICLAHFISDPDRAILAQCWPVWLAHSRQSYNPIPVNSLLEAGVPVDIEGPPETWRKLIDLFPSAVGRFDRG